MKAAVIYAATAFIFAAGLLTVILAEYRDQGPMVSMDRLATEVLKESQQPSQHRVFP